MKIRALQRRQFNDALQAYLNEYSKMLSDRAKLKQCAELALEQFIIASPNEDIANNWSYKITTEKNKAIITINNSADIIENFHYNSKGKTDAVDRNGVNIAIIVDRGHATGDGRWIEGKHYLEAATNNACEAITTFLREETQ